jgi:hypothetical protein
MTNWVLRLLRQECFTVLFQIGVLEAAKEKGQHRVTWQPEGDIRIALVVVSYNDGYVAAGRSMREAEGRTDSLIVIITLIWMITLFVTFCVIYFFERKQRSLTTF